MLDVVATASPTRLAVFVDREGDLSTYWLHVSHPVSMPSAPKPVQLQGGLSLPNSIAGRGIIANRPALIEPALDYLAKDYQSFRRLLMDLAPQLNPDFTDSFRPI